MRKVQVFKPGKQYRLTKDYYREAWPLIYEARAGDILIFQYKTVGGFVQFQKLLPDADGRFHPIMMAAREAFRLMEELS